MPLEEADQVPFDEARLRLYDLSRYEVQVNEVKYRTTRYEAAQAVARMIRGSLIDRGANGGIIGADAVVIHVHQRRVDVTGIDNHELNSLKIVDASAKIMTNRGWAIAVMRQYAYHGIRTTIHSAPQIEAYKNYVNDKSMAVGGKQCIKTLDGYIIPLDIINGLPYMKMQPNTTEEYENLPHIFLTGDEPWDPSVLDNVISDKDDWQNTLKHLDQGCRLTNRAIIQNGNSRFRDGNNQKARSSNSRTLSTVLSRHVQLT